MEKNIGSIPSPKQLKYTKSFTYVFPMLGNDTVKNFPYVLNCYTGDVDRPSLDSSIFLLSSAVEKSRFRPMVEGLRDLRIFIEEYPISEMHNMLVFKIPDIYEHDFKNFKAGKYSYMNPEYKAQILEFFEGSHFNTTRIKQVLFRDKELKIKLENDLGCEIPSSLDLSDPPDPETETFNKRIHI